MDGSLTDPRSLARAASALRCLPLRRAFYERVAVEAISSGSLCEHPDRSRYWFRPLTPKRAEDHLIWLIRLGVLRREVDGQGLTERVRLTPMGRQLLGRWPGELPRADLGERLLHGLRRRRPRL
ncbi:Npun_F0494 family protein [Vulcanococcus limneticus]|uniref:Npun_F0494 family protein n=1 Tax=Vulcanococcus limneticus TaxID=2170428 RepID=UPI000B97DCCE|nr:Npun_F0494 family protein [Vulcanococcus limneticus]MCP9790447.1 hypothetical protein [Vulcanococcus limneticus MW73D5]MCP9892332.1 hypothetical protein [Vulcanococcus limneticus Candia 3F8]MCP9895846.1 hypothetical protein [Vulcanococcus limneticus Candia 3B3]